MEPSQRRCRVLGQHLQSTPNSRPKSPATAVQFQGANSTTEQNVARGVPRTTCFARWPRPPVRCRVRPDFSEAVRLSPDIDYCRGDSYSQQSTEDGSPKWSPHNLNLSLHDVLLSRLAALTATQSNRAVAAIPLLRNYYNQE